MPKFEIVQAAEVIKEKKTHVKRDRSWLAEYESYVRQVPVGQALRLTLETSEIPQRSKIIRQLKIAAASVKRPIALQHSGKSEIVALLDQAAKVYTEGQRKPGRPRKNGDVTLISPDGETSTIPAKVGRPKKQAATA